MNINVTPKCCGAKQKEPKHVFSKWIYSAILDSNISGDGLKGGQRVETTGETH